MENRQVCRESFFLGMMIAVTVLVTGFRLSSRKAEGRPDTRLVSGIHLVMVTVGPTSAPAVRLIDAVHTIRDSLRQFAERGNMHFSTVGVSDHWSVARGASILDKLGPFDEIIVGRNWLNTGIAAYVDALEGGQSVPQVIVYRVAIRVDTLPIVRGHPDVIVRLGTSSRIVDFAEYGVRIPSVGEMGGKGNGQE